MGPDWGSGGAALTNLPADGKLQQAGHDHAIRAGSWARMRNWECVAAADLPWCLIRGLKSFANYLVARGDGDGGVVRIWNVHQAHSLLLLSFPRFQSSLSGEAPALRCQTPIRSLPHIDVAFSN